MKFNLIDRLKSFRNAFSGIAVLIKYEHNARIHLLILIAVVAAGLLLHITTTDWIAIVIAAGFVFMSESFNTALEYLSDVISPEYNDKIRNAKDLAAAAVMIAAFMSVIIGMIIFLPKIIKLFSH
jgi:diacylglycerol kinase (ATP)